MITKYQSLDKMHNKQSPLSYTNSVLLKKLVDTNDQLNKQKKAVPTCGQKSVNSWLHINQVNEGLNMTYLKFVKKKLVINYKMHVGILLSSLDFFNALGKKIFYLIFRNKKDQYFLLGFS